MLVGPLVAAVTLVCERARSQQQSRGNKLLGCGSAESARSSINERAFGVDLSKPIRPRDPSATPDTGIRIDLDDCVAVALQSALEEALRPFPGENRFESRFVWNQKLDRFRVEVFKLLEESRGEMFVTEIIDDKDRRHQLPELFNSGRR